MNVCVSFMNNLLGLQPLNNLLTPKVKGMELSMDKLRNYFDAVYDVTVIYEGTKDSSTGKRIPTPSMFGK